METHNTDPIDPSEPDPWERLGDQFASLREKLKDTYRQQSADEGPSEDDVKNAFRTLGKAWDRLADAVGTAVKDESVRQQVKGAATGFFEAVGSAFSQLGSELRKTGRDPDAGDEVPPAS
ncbi:MAG: hypothetical protein ACR2NT_13675 [Acidimicrobiia bacterium]|nr:hypothetical protein [Acidimicrobiia bacterium]MDQ3501987.1 hypothetical protein [Actinomycetota bacterium]